MRIDKKHNGPMKTIQQLKKTVAHRKNNTTHDENESGKKRTTTAQ